MDGIFWDYLGILADPFVNPQKRVFVGYLASALLIAVAVQIATQRAGLADALRRVFSRKVWLSPSARADYKILAINQALMMGLAPRLVSKLAVATLLFESLHVWFDGRVLVLTDAPDWTVAALFTAAVFLMDDASKYLVHRALHRWPVLWAFHRVHHSAETLTPLTVYRTHPVEAVIFSLRGVVVQAVCVAGFLYFFGPRADLVTVLGANVFLFAFNAAGSNLRHSHVLLTYGPILERLFISPAQHQIHHSVDLLHHDRNFGAILAIWDALGGTLHAAEPGRRIRFGAGEHGAAVHGLGALYLVPFADALRALARLFRKDSPAMTRAPFVRRPMRWGAGALTALAALAALGGSADAATLNVYSHRQPFLIEPFIEAYTKMTGTEVNIVYASKGLAQRLQAEGERSPADLVLTVDIARLHVYADKDLLAAVDSPVLAANVPPHLRDPENRWFAFSKRARVIAVAKGADDANAIRTYEELADPKWKGRICSRPGSHVYNRALIASMIYHSGQEAAQKWAQGVVDNLARRPQGNDRAQVKAVYEGQCDIAVINNYYYGKLKTSDDPEHRAWADAVNLIFPNQDGRGTHVNISGGGIAKYAPNKDEALRFMEFLTEKTAQQLYGHVNFEYPVNPDVPPSDELGAWGTFKEDEMPIIEVSNLAREAQIIIDRVGW